MKKIIEKLIICMILVFTIVGLTSCKAKVTPSVVFGFKTTDTAGDYNESIDAFEIGKDFYTCIKVKLVTDKKAPKDYTVVIEVPKTNDIVVDQTGGRRADSVVWDKENQKSIMKFTISGSKEAVTEKILFKGTPVGEGNAELTVTIFDDEGVQVGTEYFRTIFFKYELQ